MSAALCSSQGPGAAEFVQRQGHGAGREIDFEKLTLSRHGIGKEKEFLPWSEVKDITLDENNHVLTIQKKGNWLSWFTAPVAEIPNVHVFQALAQRARGVVANQE